MVPQLPEGRHVRKLAMSDRAMTWCCRRRLVVAAGLRQNHSRAIGHLSNRTRTSLAGNHPSLCLGMALLASYPLRGLVYRRLGSQLIHCLLFHWHVVLSLQGHLVIFLFLFIGFLACPFFI